MQPMNLVVQSGPLVYVGETHLTWALPDGEKAKATISPETNGYTALQTFAADHGDRFVADSGVRVWMQGALVVGYAGPPGSARMVNHLVAEVVTLHDPE